MTELNPFGLDDLIATVEEACNDTFRKDWLLLRLRYARSRAPVPTTGENPYRKLDDEFDHAAEALTWDEGYAAGFAAGRAAASPDERLREAVAALPQYVITIQDREGYTYERGREGQPMNYTGVMLADVEALVGELKDHAPAAHETTDELKDSDERLREALARANDDLILIADEAPEDIGESIDSVRAAIKDALAADREENTDD